MDKILFPFLGVVNSILLVKYYGAFLTPQKSKLTTNFMIVGFGSSYLLFWFIIRQLFTELPIHFSLVRVIIMASAIFILSLVFFKNELGLQIFLISSFIAVQELCLFISISLFSLSGDLSIILLNSLWNKGIFNTEETVQTYFNIHTTAQYAVLMLTYTAINVVALESINKSFVYKKQSLHLSKILLLILPCFSGFSITFIMRAIIFKAEGDGLKLIYDNVPFIGVLIPSAGFFLLVSILAFVKLFQNLIGLSIEEKNSAVFQQQTQQIQEQIQDLDSIYTEIRGMRHDMKGHIANIKVLVNTAIESGQDIHRELDEYVGKMVDTLNKFDLAYQTGNPITDVVIHQKYLESANKGINFSSDFVYPAYLNLDSYDLAIILNNALENAIEACDALKQSGRFVRLSSYSKGEIFFIEIENSFAGKVLFNEQTGLPISNKADKSAHGIGLSNIKRCAKKYFGNIDCQVLPTDGENVFRLTILLQGRD